MGGGREKYNKTLEWDKDPHGWKKTHGEHSKQEIQCKSPLALPSGGHISILSRENLFLWCCIFLFCPLEEIPELAPRRLMPQLPSPCFSSCWQGEETLHALFLSVQQSPCAHTVRVYVCVCVLCVCPLCKSYGFTRTPDVWEDKRCMCACWCVC